MSAPFTIPNGTADGATVTINDPAVTALSQITASFTAGSSGIQRIEVVPPANGSFGIIPRMGTAGATVNGNTAGVYDVYTPAPDAEATSLLRPAFPLVTKTANYSATAADTVIQVTGSAGPTITLPAPASVPNKLFIVKNYGTATNATTIATAAGQIDGASTASLAAGNTVGRYLSDGTNYNAI